jgi:DNA-binding transcriptional MerR regulator
MFTQLDLFGDLPAPEKPSNQPQRAEKKSAAKSTANAQTLQTQLSMGLPEDLFPEPSRSWSEQEIAQPSTTAEETVAESPTSHSDTDIEVQTEKSASKETSLSETTPELTSNAPGLNSSTEQVELRQAPDVPAINSEVSKPEIATETKAEKGRRYYIQTEIPADPPLTEKPPGPEILMTGLIQTRNTAQEAKPRYIQTEIPSDPIEKTQVATQISLIPTSEQYKKDTIGSPNDQSSSGNELPQTKTGDTDKPDNKQKASSIIPPESLRRTRPLMPPKVILAEPETKAQPERSEEPQKIITAVQNPTVIDPPSISSAPGVPEHSADLTPAAPAKPSLSIKDVQPEPESAIPFTENVLPAEKTSARRKKVSSEPAIESIGVGVPPDDLLNARQYYSIGEVANMFGVKSSLLRYWESEFDVLKLRKNRKGDRFFRPDDIRSLQLIHHLLREKKYTIEGAREYMRNAGKMKEKFETIETLRRIRQFLVEMRNGLQIEKIPDL